MKNILVINECLSDNLGDVAIGESISTYLRLKGNNVKCIDYTKKSKIHISSYYKYEDKDNLKVNKANLIKTKLKEIFPIIKTIIWFKNNKSIYSKVKKESYDKVIIGGGQLLLSNGYFVQSLLLWFIISKVYLKSEVYLYGVGIGDKISFIDKMIFKLILPKFNKIYVRDKNSKEKLEKLNLKKEIKLSPDIVYYFNKINKKEGLIKKKLILISIMDYSIINNICNRYDGEEEFMEEWLRLVRENNDKNYEVKICYTTNSDKDQAYRFIKYCNEVHGLRFDVVNTNDLDSFIEIVSVASKVISARMHALILAQNYNCEVIPFVFSDKLKSFSEENINNFSLEEFQEKIDYSFKEILGI
ncbi:polysaccharide pyruvyl transferase family protein [Clostridium mediterraneense]|uniref:polysaccharide pyruvyl transferase family protein n=1 Tax=Clostridium mediterraneense TaxID=1805472 RepID=UPI00135659C9|nr:polysaccharide pyruvyl transferase family protein [Clostridium mediterraneense]